MKRKSSANLDIDVSSIEKRVKDESKDTGYGSLGGNGNAEDSDIEVLEEIVVHPTGGKRKSEETSQYKFAKLSGFQVFS